MRSLIEAASDLWFWLRLRLGLIELCEGCPTCAPTFDYRES